MNGVSRAATAHLNMYVVRTICQNSLVGTVPTKAILNYRIDLRQNLEVEWGVTYRVGKMGEKSTDHSPQSTVHRPRSTGKD